MTALDRLRDWPDVVSGGLRAIGVLGGFVAGFVTILGYVGAPQQGWGIGAFDAMGGMAGFMLAGLALIEAAKGSAEMKSLIGSPAWSGLLSALVVSMFAWALPATVALLNWIFGWSWTWPLFVALACWGAFESLRAMFWIYAVIRRFRV